VTRDHVVSPGGHAGCQTAEVARDDWYRGPDWDEAAQTLFAEKLARARPWSRSQYMSIKAIGLIASTEVAAQSDGADLLRQVIAMGDEFEVASCHELLGEHLAGTGRVDDGVVHLRAAIESRGPSFGTDTTELTLAEVLLGRRAEGDLAEVYRLLTSPPVQPEDSGDDYLVFTSQFYRYWRCRALWARAVGDERAAEWASTAMALAAVREPQFPRHPDVGLVHAVVEELDELREIAAGLA